jgi:hypothetical protein
VVKLGPYKVNITSYTWPAQPRPGQKVYVATSFPSEVPLNEHEVRCKSYLGVLLYCVAVFAGIFGWEVQLFLLWKQGCFYKSSFIHLLQVFSAACWPLTNLCYSFLPLVIGNA